VGSHQGIRVSGLRVFGFLDSALGKEASRGEGDFAAIVTVGRDAHGWLYVLDAWLERATPSRQIARIFELNARWNYTAFGYEANSFQALLGPEIAAESERQRAGNVAWRLPAQPWRHTHNKHDRIAALEPLITNGWLRFSKHLPEEFFIEADEFPHAAHDDAMDALAACVVMARSKMATEIKRFGVRVTPAAKAF
jgi:predicted phage terminase large subunit-like protein